MQVSAMHSKACQAFISLFFSVLLCPFLSPRVDAEESPAGDSPQPIYEMNAKEKLTPEEEYAMQWGDVFVSDLAEYSLNVKTGHLNPDDPNELVMNVRAIYKDRNVLERLKEQYADKLQGGSLPICNEMELHFHMHEAEYAITQVRIYNQKHQLISEAKREPIYKKIPSNSFVQAMYRIGERFVEYQKSVGKKSEQQAAHR